MNEKIFIAWSGDNSCAKKVAELLESNDFGTIIGGNTSDEENLVFVGATIISQMKKCTQAIILIQKKPNENVISSNLMFEFGYLLNKLSFNKIHVFFIDIEENDIKIPSDIRGIWADFLKNDKELASKIVKEFIQRQNSIISDDKLNIILNSHYYKGLISSFAEEPQCSSFELSQYLIFYIQAVYFNEDYDEINSIVNKLNDSYHYYSKELQLALTFCKVTLEFYSVFYSQESSDITLDKLERTKDKYEEMLERVESIKDSEYKTWLYAEIYEHLGFIHYFYLMSSNDSDEVKYELHSEVIKYDMQLLKCLSKIKTYKNPNRNSFFIALFTAYAYRQKSIAHRNLYNIKHDIEEKKKAHECFIKAFEIRKKLYNDYPNITLNPKIKENMEIEYYLAMSEIINYNEYANNKSRFTKEITRYLNNQQNKRDGISQHLELIKNNIKGVNL